MQQPPLHTVSRGFGVLGIIAAVVFMFCISPVSADTFSEDALKDFNRLDSIYNSIGADDPVQGLSISERQVAIADSLHADTLLVKAFLNKGNSLTYFGLFDQAMKEYYSALAIAEKGRHTGYEADALFNIGMNFTNQFDFRQCTDYLQKAKGKYIAAGRFRDTVKVNFQLGFMLTAADSLEKGMAMIEKNLDVVRRSNDPQLVVTGLQDLAQVYFDQKNYKRALEYMLDIFNYPEGLASTTDKAAAYCHLTEVYVEMQQWDNVKRYLQEAFKYAFMAHSKDWIYEAYLSQSKMEAGTGHYKEALQSRIQYILYKDSVFNKNYDDKIAALSSLYELDKKQNRISLLEKDKEISASKIKQEQWRRNSVIAGSVLVIVLLVSLFLVRLQRNKKRMQISFSRSLIQQQEQERRRTSQELHDSVGQNILFIKNQLSGQRSDASTALLMETVDATIEEVRNISKELYPNQLEKYGLSAAVDALAEKVSNTTGIFVSADLHEIEDVLWREANINLYRIIQEALNNVIKHAGAKAVRITGTRGGNKIEVTVQDNGKGFNTAILERKAQRSYGLLNIEERARMLDGEFTLRSTPGGTKISVTIPVRNEV